MSGPSEKSAQASVTLSNELLQNAERSVLCWFATVGADGQPNVSPKEIWELEKDGLLKVADIASPKSIRNISENPKVCVSFIDVFSQRGFKIVGSAIAIPNSDTNFDSRARNLLQMCGNDFKIRNLIEIEIECYVPILAPSYALYPGTTEEDMRSSAFHRYGVRPVMKTKDRQNGRT